MPIPKLKSKHLSEAFGIFDGDALFRVYCGCLSFGRINILSTYVISQFKLTSSQCPVVICQKNWRKGLKQVFDIPKFKEMYRF